MSEHSKSCNMSYGVTYYKGCNCGTSRTPDTSAKVDVEKIAHIIHKRETSYRWETMSDIWQENCRITARDIVAALSQAPRSDAVELVRELVEELKCYRDCLDCNGTGEVYNEASNLMGHHGWLTCWKCHNLPIMQKITKAEQWLKNRGDV